MFKATNAYDEIVTKATDETLTSENWQLNLDVCDKVTAEGETGARNCVAAILKRLVHRNANVQLYALTLSDALSKNCGLVAHRELASRSYCQTLQRIVTDRNTHNTVKRKGLALVKEWTSEWGNDESLGIMRETVETLKRQGVSFQDEPQDPPAEPSSEQLRAEDEELRRVLELSLQDQGGRAGYQPSGSSIGPSGAGYAPSSSTAAAGYAPSASAAVSKSLPDPAPSAPPTQQQRSGPAASRVRALYDFVPSEEGELAFRKGDVVRVLDSVYEHWWRGELNGTAGIFPVNYVEILPDPSPADIQREAELEARIFAQANDIDRLLSKLRGLDPSRDNLADDEELQELYQSSLSMRPKIVKLIDRYNLKVSELRGMNEKFVRARSTYDAMMQDSVQRRAPSAAAGPAAYAQGRMPSYGSGSGAPPGPAGYGAQDYGRQYPQEQAYPQQQQTTPMPHHTQSQPQPQSQPQQTSQAMPQVPPGAPPYGTPEYAQWYYAQQQGGAPQSNGQQHPQHVSSGSGAPGMTPSTSATASAPAAQPSFENPHKSPDDTEDEKRRMFERARAEAEAYHRAHQQHQQQQSQGYAPQGYAPGQQQGSGSMAAPSAPLL